jgi:hypothetical protein
VVGVVDEFAAISVDAGLIDIGLPGRKAGDLSKCPFLVFGLHILVLKPIYYMLVHTIGLHGSYYRTTWFIQ